MENAIITHGVLIDKETIRLDEPLSVEYKNVKVVIEAEDYPSKRTRVFGSAKGEIYIHPEFDEPIEDFKEYTQ